jgi:hypothetical protein
MTGFIARQVLIMAVGVIGVVFLVAEGGPTYGVVIIALPLALLAGLNALRWMKSPEGQARRRGERLAPKTPS